MLLNWFAPPLRWCNTDKEFQTANSGKKGIKFASLE